MNVRLKRHAHWVAMLAMASAACIARAQEFPTKRMTVIVPYPPGGVTDWMGRTVGEQLQKRWGKPVVVDNRPGAGGSVGAQALKSSEPDGHVLMVATNTMASYPVFTKNPVYDISKDVAAVATAFYAPYVLLTNTQVPAKSLREFIAYAKANPGKLNFATTAGSSQMLDTVDLLKKAGIEMAIVSYKGGADALRAVIANEAQAYFGAAFGLDAQVKAGKITALAVTSALAFPILPSIPTVKAATGLDFDTSPVYGFVTTAGTPRPVVDKLFNEIRDIVANADLSARIREQGYEPLILSPDTWASVFVRESKRAGDIARAAGVAPQ